MIVDLIFVDLVPRCRDLSFAFDFDLPFDGQWGSQLGRQEIDTLTSFWRCMQGLG